MRQPRNLKLEKDNPESENIRFVSEAATLWLIQNLPEEEKQTLRHYMQTYGNDWWRKLDLDTGGVLGNEFKRFGYTDSFLGQPELQKRFKDILLRVVVV